jgi:hypothetical protein
MDWDTGGGGDLGLLTALLAFTIAIRKAMMAAMIASMLLLQDPDKEPKYDRDNSQRTQLNPVHDFRPKNKYYSIGEDHQEDHRNKHGQAGRYKEIIKLLSSFSEVCHDSDPKCNRENSHGKELCYGRSQPFLHVRGNFFD